MKEQQDKKAIVIAFFGTSYPSALKAIINIENKIKRAFSQIEIRIAFTSTIIRKIWHNRQNDEIFFTENKDIPQYIYKVKSPLATIADLQDEGYNIIVVQSTHIFEGEEYTDLSSCIRGLNSIKTIKAKNKPFKKLVLGRPLLGVNGTGHDYHHDLIIAAKAVNDDIVLAKKNKAALVYMGHGNEFYSTGAYIEFQKTLREIYKDIPIFVGCVEGFPSLDDVTFSLKHHGRIKKVLLKPFMIVAGDHAKNDMAGEEDDSWKSIFENMGLEVITAVEGLGEYDKIGDIFIQHIKDVTKDNGITI